MLTKFLWLQNTDHGWPILLVFRFSKISMLRFFKKENSLVTVALENHFPLNLILVQERIASGDQISCFMKTSIMKFYHWLEVNIYRRFSCHASNKFCQWIHHVFWYFICSIKKKGSGAIPSEKQSLKNTSAVHISDTQFISLFLTLLSTCLFFFIVDNVHWFFC